MNYTFSFVDLVDTTAPYIRICPADIIEKVDKGTNEFPVYWEPPSATDLSGNITVTQTHAPGDMFAVGPAHIVRYTFTDPSDNWATCSFRINVIQGKLFLVECMQVNYFMLMG